MADLLNVTPSYFSRFFKKTMGMTFLEYTSLIRLERAYTDIVTTDYPISLKRMGLQIILYLIRNLKKDLGIRR